MRSNENSVSAGRGRRVGVISGSRRSALRRRFRRSRGFTLIEAALTTVIVGTGVLAIVAAQQAYHRKNDWAQRTGTAVLLANELRELTLTLPQHDPIDPTHMGPESNETSVSQYDDLDDFAGTVTSGVGSGTTFSPPINALKQTVPNLNGWSQTISVANVLDDNISTTFTQPLGTTRLMRVSVDIYYQAPGAATPMLMTNLTWVVGE